MRLVMMASPSLWWIWLYFTLMLIVYEENLMKHEDYVLFFNLKSILFIFMILLEFGKKYPKMTSY